MFQKYYQVKAIGLSTAIVFTVMLLMAMLAAVRPAAILPTAILPMAIQPAAADTVSSWAIAEFGQPLYQEGIEHWPYANPSAPKGGKIVLGGFGSFDSLNPLILKGNPVAGLWLTSDSLTVSSGDELASAYGLIAKRIEYDETKSWIRFYLRSEARFHDNHPITADDFVFAFEALRTYGRPFMKAFFQDVAQAKAEDSHILRFDMKKGGSMKPLIKVAGLAPLPRHYWKNKDLSKTFLEPPVASGPYRIAKVDPGRSITYERVKDYWARDLAMNRGLHNFDQIRYDYYLDEGVMFEAFKAGKIDFWFENTAKRWARGYDIPQVKKGHIVLRPIPDVRPEGIQAFFINLRKPRFQDRRVRQALALLFDFESTQRLVLNNQYIRTASFFPKSDFGASGLPPPDELAVLEPFRSSLPAEVFSQAYQPSRTDGSGQIRSQLRQALRLLASAGWNLVDGQLVNDVSGEPMKIEFLLLPTGIERIVTPFVANLKRAGMEATMQLVDTSQYGVRLDDFDFDIVVLKSNFFPPPGPELRSYFGSAAADQRGSGNWSGFKSPAADALIDKIVNADTLEQLKVLTRALDRILLWNYHAIPHFHLDIQRLAYWDILGSPQRLPKYGSGFPSLWWYDSARAAKLTRQ